MWKAIPGHVGRYEASDEGHIRNARTLRVLKPGRCTNGYLRIALGRASPHNLVHRLIALTFLPGADPSMQVNHRNGKRDDNRLVNLEWLSCSDNHRHSYAALNRKQHALTLAVVLTKGAERLEFPSMLAAANAIGLAPGSIASAMARGHKAKGYEVNHV